MSREYDQIRQFTILLKETNAVWNKWMKDKVLLDILKQTYPELSFITKVKLNCALGKGPFSLIGNDQAVNRLAIYKRKKSIDRKKYVCYYFSLHNKKVPKLNIKNVEWLNGVSDIVSDSLMTHNVCNMLGFEQPYIRVILGWQSAKCQQPKGNVLQPTNGLTFLPSLLIDHTKSTIQKLTDIFTPEKEFQEAICKKQITPQHIYRSKT
jgi:hypothetical protein